MDDATYDKIKNVLVRNERMSGIDWLVDAVIAAGAFGFACLQLTMAVNLLFPDELLRRLLGVESVAPTGYAILAIALTTAPLVVRRRFPWPVLAVTLLLWGLFQSQMGTVSFSLAGPLVALFTVAYELPRVHAVAGAAVSVVVILFVPQADPSGALSSLTLLQNIAFALAATFAGYALRIRGDFLRAAEERAAEAERTRETEANRRVEEERVRIAREVHDITAHSLSAVSIQAAAAERLVDIEPAAAKEAIANVRATSKSALDDIRAMIGVLRSGEGSAQTAPTEGTDQLPALAAYLQDAGVTCMLDASGYDRVAVPAHIDVALFGIAREATTNIVRHAQARHAWITLRTAASAAGRAHVVPERPAFAEIVVEDDGVGLKGATSKGAAPSTSSGDASGEGASAGRGAGKKARPDGEGASAAARDAGAGRSAGGHGIEGMEERVRVLGGSFEAAPRAEGGFRVYARVPLPAKVPGDVNGTGEL